MIFSKHKQFKAHVIGLSSDGRTNKWSVTCLKCNKTHIPQTTILSKQLLICPHCNEEDSINYNQNEMDK